MAGEVRARPWTDWAEERLGTPGRKWLRPPPGSPAARGGEAGEAGAEAFELARGRPTLAKGQEQWLLKFKGVNDRNAAEALRGWTVVVGAGDRPSLSAGVGGGDEVMEYYASDLVGLGVRDGPSGALVGTVAEVLGGTGTYDTLEVVVAADFPPGEAPAPDSSGQAPRRTLLVPFAREIVPSVDLEAQELLLTPPGGLYSLIVQPKTGKKKKKMKKRGGKRATGPERGQLRAGRMEAEADGMSP